MLDLAAAGIAHIAAHTNLDSAPGGVNDTLMAAMGAENIRGEGFVRAGDLPGGMTLGRLAALARTRLHGEVRIYAEDGGASITLRRNGHVEIEGDLFINGAMYVPPVS